VTIQLGIRSRVLLGVLCQDPARWPAGELIAIAGLRPEPAFEALDALRRLELVAAEPSDDGVVRFVPTPLGRRTAAARRGG
jgi:hypothetical protein